MDCGQLFLGFFAWLGATVFGTAIGIFLAKLYLKRGSINVPHFAFKEFLAKK